jgi:SAM-dependent methyltransferase
VRPFADHFSSAAAEYAAYRPRYPETLFDRLAEVAPSRAMAWDCATGNGQAALALAARFEHVLATDPSTAQLAQAPATERVSYAAMTAEHAAIASRSVALVTVAQALHWIDRAAFYAEVRRVLVSGGVLAIWSYGLGRFGDPDLDEALARFHDTTVGPYWPAERVIVDAGYETLEFPFDELPGGRHDMAADWSLDQLLGYLSTWSAGRRARTATGVDPLPAFGALVRPFWGIGSRVRRISWPLGLRIGRVE